MKRKDLTNHSQGIRRGETGIRRTSTEWTTGLASRLQKENISKQVEINGTI